MKEQASISRSQAIAQNMRPSIRNAAYSIAAYIIPTAAMLFAYRVFDQVMGRNASGIYLFCTSLATSFSFLGFGLASAVTRFVAGAEEHREKGRIYTCGMLAYAVIGLVLGALICIFAGPLSLKLDAPAELRHTAYMSTLVGGLMVPLAMVNEIGVAMFKGLQDFRSVAINRSLLSVFSFLVAPALLILFKLQVFQLMLVTLLGYLAIWVFTAWQLRRSGHGFEFDVFRHPAAYRSQIYQMFRFGGVLALVSLLAFSYFQAQRFIVAFALGPAAVATYLYAISAVSRVHGVISAGTEIIFPSTVARRNTERPEQLRAFYVKAQAGAFLIAVLFCGLLWLLSDVLVRLWLGSARAGQVPELIKLFALGYIALSLSPVPYHIANALDKSHFNLWNIALRTGVNLGLLLLFWSSSIDLDTIAIAFVSATLLIDGIIWPLAVNPLLFKPRSVSTL